MDNNVVKPEPRQPLTMAVKTTRTEYKAQQTKMYNCDRDARRRELFHLKQEIMPMIMPLPQPLIEFKCRLCNVGNLTYTAHNNWYLEPVDVLAKKIDPDAGFIDWSALAYSFNELVAYVKGTERTVEEKKVILMKRLTQQLPEFMTKIAVLPAQIRMMTKLQRSDAHIPIVYVLSTDNAIDVIALNYILMKNQLKTAVVIVDKTLEVVDGMDKMTDHLKSICRDVCEDLVLDCFQSVQSIAVILNKANDDKALDVLLKASGYGFDSEIYLIPVAISHEISNLQLSRNASNCGLIRVAFNEPYLVKDLIRIKEFGEINEDLELTERVSHHLWYDLILRHPVMCTNVVAFLLLNQFRDGTTVVELAKALEKFCKANDQIYFNFKGEYEHIVYHAIRLYGKDVMILDKDLVKINLTSGNLVHLYGYAKVMLPHLVMNAIVVTCAHFMKRIDAPVNYFIVLDRATELSRMLSFEFVLIKPCEEMDAKLNATLDNVILMGLLTKYEREYSEYEMEARKIARHFEETNGDSEEEEQERQYKYRKEDELFLNEAKTEEWKEILKMLKPILWNYLTVAECLVDLIEAEPISEVDFIETCHKKLLMDYESRKCKFGESLSKDSMKNYLKYLELKFVIETGFETEDVEMKTKKIWLTDEFNAKGDVDILIRNVYQYLDETVHDRYADTAT